MTASAWDRFAGWVHAKGAIGLGWVVSAFLIALLVGGVLAGPVVFGWQVIHYLQSGDWTAVSVLDVIAANDARSSAAAWARQPTEWLGLWKILHWLPASVVLTIVGWFVAAGVADDLKRRASASRVPS